jgi:hypothetical protein
MVLVADGGGCAQINTVDTQASSDGLRAEIGDLLLSNLMVLSADDGQPGTVLGAVADHGDETASVSIGLAGRPSADQSEIAPDDVVLLDPDEHRIRLHDMPKPPGAVVDLHIVASAVHRHEGMASPGANPSGVNLLRGQEWGSARPVSRTNAPEVATPGASARRLLVHNGSPDQRRWQCPRLASVTSTQREPASPCTATAPVAVGRT